MQAVLTNAQYTVIRPQGSLNAANALEFERDLTGALRKEETTAMLVNLSQVDSLDSAGLMALVSSLKLAQALGKRFSICGISPSLRIIFELTQLDSVFEILDGEVGLTTL
jgi:anti-sigma B factor antagonist